MAFSMTFSVLILSIILFCPSFVSPRVTNSSLSSPTFSSPSKGKKVGFSVRLIHQTSPESPFYNRSANPNDVIKSSLLKSLARSHYFGWIISKNYSMKFPYTPYDLISGDYVMKFKIGTPPVDTYAIADTASSLIWLQCLPCISCYEQSVVPVFDPSNSSSYQPVLYGSQECNNTVESESQESNVTVDNECKGTQFPCNCTYSMKYEDKGFSEGAVARESFTFQNDGRNGPPDVHVNMVFGCGHNNSDPVGGEAPGVMGLTNHSTSALRQLSFFELSYCFSSNTTQGHSHITFGAAADVLQGFTTSLAPTVEGLYVFKNVDGIYVDGWKVDGIPEWVFQFAEDGLGGLMIDTGTIFTRLYKLALDELVEALIDKIPLTPVLNYTDEEADWPLCYSIEDFEKITTLPDIEIRFTDNNESSLWLSDGNVWIDNDYGEKCLAMAATDKQSILGIYQQRDMRVGYDLRRKLVSMEYTYCP